MVIRPLHCFSSQSYKWSCLCLGFNRHHVIGGFFAGMSWDITGGAPETFVLKRQLLSPSVLSSCTSQRYWTAAWRSWTGSLCRSSLILVSHSIVTPIHSCIPHPEFRHCVWSSLIYHVLSYTLTTPIHSNPLHSDSKATQRRVESGLKAAQISKAVHILAHWVQTFLQKKQFPGYYVDRQLAWQMGKYHPSRFLVCLGVFLLDLLDILPVITV